MLVRYRVYLVIAAFATFSTLATSATWVVVGDNDSVVVFVDKDSIRRNGSRVKSWLKWQWTQPAEIPNSYPTKKYQSEKQLQVSDCANNTLAIAQGIMYSDATGDEVVESYTIAERAWKFSEAAPETIGESIIKFVCRASAPKKR